MSVDASLQVKREGKIACLLELEVKKAERARSVFNARLDLDF